MNKLEFKNKSVLVEGEWNGQLYPAKFIKMMVDEVNSLDESARAKVLSIYKDHKEDTQNWVGSASNLRWDESDKTAKADLIFIEEDVVKKLLFQIEEHGESSWGISPSLTLQKDQSGKLTKLSLRNMSVVIDAAQGDKTQLEIRQEGGFMDFLKFSIKDLEDKSPEDQNKLLEAFLASAESEIVNAKEKIKKEEDGIDGDKLIDVMDKVNEIKGKTEKTDFATRVTALIKELEFVISVLQDKCSSPKADKE